MLKFQKLKRELKPQRESVTLLLSKRFAVFFFEFPSGALALLISGRPG